MNPLVKLWQRPSSNGRSFKYYLIYVDSDGKRRQKSLGHADKRKAMKAKASLEAKLIQGYTEPKSMRLNQLLQDYLLRTRGQVRQSTLDESKRAMKDFISCISDIDSQKVQHRHGEIFLQDRLDRGNAPATVGKKLRHLKRVFQLSVERCQLDKNPLRYVKQPKVAQKSVKTFNLDECLTLLRVARQYQQVKNYIQWELLFEMALCTGMRRGELLNTTWADIDFDKKIIEVSPKQKSDETWVWYIKDTDRRKLPLTNKLVVMLAGLQSSAFEHNPYVFVPAERYQAIRRKREAGNWTVEHGKRPLNNFNRLFKKILSMAGLCGLTFHDLRRTCLSRWIEKGLSEFEVMNLAGHSTFETTRKFYLAVNNNIVDRARATFDEMPKSDSVANLLQQPFSTNEQKGQQI